MWLPERNLCMVCSTKYKVCCGDLCLKCFDRVVAVKEEFCGCHHHHYLLSLNCEGRWGTTDDFATIFLHLSLFSTALWDLSNSRPVHSMILSFHLFLCLPCLLPLFTVPCKMVWARPDWISCSIHKILWKLAYLVLSKLRFSFKDIKWSGNLPISV